jgi:hypothetical protein
MKKSFKKIFASLLAVMMIAMMVPFTASAADTLVTNQLSLSCTKENFKFDVYKIATINLTTNAVTVTATDTKVAADVKLAGSTTNTQTLIADCDAADVSKLGTKIGSFTSSSSTTSATFTDNVEAGIYYIRTTALGNATKASSSIVTLPTYSSTSKSWTNTGTISLDPKVANGDVTVEKKIVENYGTDDASEVSYTSASVGETVTFKLSASVPGSTNKPVKSFAIVDSMDAGLSSSDVSIKSVTQGDTTFTTSDYTLFTDKTDAALKDDNGKAYSGDFTFGVKLTDSGLKKLQSNVVDSTGAITKAAPEVVVYFQTKVTSDAVVGGTGNKNSDGLVYKNNDAALSTVDGEKVQVFCFNINLVKKDTNTSGATLSGAVFALKDANKNAVKDASGNAVTGTTDADGKTNFGGIKLAAGKYYVVETKAPDGYVLDTTEHSVEISYSVAKNTKGLYEVSDNYTAQSIEVYNVKITVPQTGGVGTKMFTICGACLIAVAGVMFVVLKKKKTSK